jgi:hypothetical protein
VAEYRLDRCTNQGPENRQPCRHLGDSHASMQEKGDRESPHPQRIRPAWNIAAMRATLYFFVCPAGRQCAKAPRYAFGNRPPSQPVWWGGFDAIEAPKAPSVWRPYFLRFIAVQVELATALASSRHTYLVAAQQREQQHEYRSRLANGTLAYNYKGSPTNGQFGRWHEWRSRSAGRASDDVNLQVETPGYSQYRRSQSQKIQFFGSLR